MKFSDIPHFIFKTYFERIFKANFQSYDNTSSLLIGPKTTIITESSNIMEIFIEDKNFGLFPVKFKVDYYPMKKENKFKVELPALFESTGKKSNEISGTDYEFVLYDLKQIDIPNIENGSRVFLRKDSYFFTWLNNFGVNIFKNNYLIDFIIRNYINSDKSYIYIGDIYKNSSGMGYYIYHYNIWNYVMECIPTHQRTEKLTELVYLNFDILYNEVYSLQKDIWNLIDPFECKEDFLGNLSEYFGIDYEKYKDIDTDVKRWFLWRLPLLLKQRGTYSGLYSLWEILTKNTKNRLNVYERWYENNIFFSHKDREEVHEWNDEKYYWYDKEPTYKDWLYTSFYMQTDLYSGAGYEWYKKFHYITYPLKYGYETILYEKGTQNALFEVYDLDWNWHKIYSEELEILSDNTLIIRPFLGYVIAAEGEILEEDSNEHIVKYYYNEKKIVQDGITQYDRIVGTSPDLRIDFTSPSAEWFCSHNLSHKYLIVCAFDNEGNRIIPDKLELINEDTCILDFNSEITGYVLIKKGELIHSADGINRELSTTYIVEPDLTDEPINKQEIYSKGTSEALYNLWQIFSPSVRDDQYKLLISPLSNMKGTWNNLYDSTLIPYFNTRTNENYGSILNNCYIGVFTGEYIKIDHYLNSEDLIIDIYHNETPPVKMYNSDIDYVRIINPNSIEIKFNETQNVIILIKVGQKSVEYDKWPCDPNMFCFCHNFGNREIITQFYSIDTDNCLYPEYVNLVSDDTIQTKQTNTYFVGSHANYIEEFEDSITWEVEHYLGYDGIFVDVYDLNWNRIKPEKINVIDDNNCEISFKTSTSGYVLIKEIGDIQTKQTEESYHIIESYTNTQNVTINHNLNGKWVIIHTYDTDMNRIIPETINIVDENNIFIEFETEKDFHAVINVINEDNPDYIGMFTWILDTKMTRPIIRHYNIDNYVITPEFSKMITPTVIGIYSRECILNRVVLYNAELSIIRYNVQDWALAHNFGHSGVIVDLYSSNGFKLEADELKLTNFHVANANFNENKTGYALITPVGSYQIYLFKNKLENSSITIDNENWFSVIEVWEDLDYIYASYKIPKDEIEDISINNINIKYNVDNEIIVMSECAEIYKLSPFEMNIFYKFAKKDI